MPYFKSILCFNFQDFIDTTFCPILVHFPCSPELIKVLKPAPFWFISNVVSKILIGENWKAANKQIERIIRSRKRKTLFFGLSRCGSTCAQHSEKIIIASIFCIYIFEEEKPTNEQKLFVFLPRVVSSYLWARATHPAKNSKVPILSRTLGLNFPVADLTNIESLHFLSFCAITNPFIMFIFLKKKSKTVSFPISADQF